MKRHIFIVVVSLLLVLTGGLYTVSSLSRGAADMPMSAYLPLVHRLPVRAIVADHTHTDLSQIPQSAIEQAKSELRLFYAHTSHGSQPVSGMQVLMDDDSNNGLYDFTDDGSVVAGMLSLDDHYADLGDLGSSNWDELTRDYLDSAEGADRNVAVWSWCGQVSGSTPESMDAYLDAMTQLEQEYPEVTFVYMTGHLDGTGVDGNLNQMNTLIRNYVLAHNKVLFDFADIESYDPDQDEFLSLFATDGCYYDSNGDGDPLNDGANWATEWCAANDGDPRCISCGCAHSESLNCNLKGRAFWWMLARIAGWDGEGN